jgi:hypothetical protein
MECRLTILLTCCWAAIILSFCVLLARVDALPESIPVFVSLTGMPTMWAPTSIPMVTRIAFMGAGQLGAATLLARESSRASHADWARLFGYMAIAIAGKNARGKYQPGGHGHRVGQDDGPCTARDHGAHRGGISALSDRDVAKRRAAAVS